MTTELARCAVSGALTGWRSWSVGVEPGRVPVLLDPYGCNLVYAATWPKSDMTPADVVPEPFLGRALTEQILRIAEDEGLLEMDWDLVGTPGKGRLRATRDLGRLLRRVRDALTPPTSAEEPRSRVPLSRVAVGRVSCRGAEVVRDSGYAEIRARRMTLVALWPLSRDGFGDDVEAGLADRYGVPVLTMPAPMRLVANNLHQLVEPYTPARCAGCAADLLGCELVEGCDGTPCCGSCAHPAAGTSSTYWQDYTTWRASAGTENR